MDGKYSDYVISYGGPVVNARTFHNVSIGHQVGLEFSGAYLVPFSDVEQFDSLLMGSIKHSQLVTITDRILYQVDLKVAGENTQYAFAENPKELYLNS